VPKHLKLYMKALIIVAPTVSADTRNLLRVAVRNSLDSAAESCEIREIRAGEPMAEAVAQRMAGQVSCVVAVGGDGTVSSVAHALVGTEIPLGIVPAGTGNLVARELGIPLDVTAAVKLIAGPHRLRKIDAMEIAGRTYLLNAGVGINAEVIDRTSRLGKSLFGRSAYVGTAVWKVLQAKPQRLEITVDGETRTYEATDVLISNCGTLARVLHPNCPDIRADDGQVDVCIICMKMPLEYPWYYLRKSLFPGHVNRIIHEMPAKKSVVVRSDATISVQADGDIICTTPVTVTVQPNAVAVMVP